MSTSKRIDAFPSECPLFKLPCFFLAPPQLLSLASYPWVESSLSVSFWLGLWHLVRAERVEPAYSFKTWPLRTRWRLYCQLFRWTSFCWISFHGTFLGFLSSHGCRCHAVAMSCVALDIYSCYSSTSPTQSIAPVCQDLLRPSSHIPLDFVLSRILWACTLDVCLKSSRNKLKNPGLGSNSVT